MTGVFENVVPVVNAEEVRARDVVARAGQLREREQMIVTSLQNRYSGDEDVVVAVAPGVTVGIRR